MSDFAKAKVNKAPEKPTIGRIVHYVLSSVDCEKMKGKSRPGIVVMAHDDRLESVNLQVFTNGGHDDLPPVHWKRDVQHDESRRPGTWHWPPRANDPPFLPPANTIEELKNQLEAARTKDQADAIEREMERSKEEAAEREKAGEPFRLATPEAEHAARQEHGDGAPAPFPKTEREGFTMEIPPPAATKPSVEQAPDGLPFAEEKKGGDS